jgi:hypothetical protein
MYSRQTLETGLTVSEVLDRLATIIRPRHSFWEAVEAGLSWEQKSRPFVGKIDGHRFTIRRAIQYRNSFLPRIAGHVAPVGSGSRIDIVLRLSTPVGLFMAVWLAGAFAAAVAGVWQSIRTSTTDGLLLLAFPLFGCGFVAGGFIPEKRKAIKLLTAALAATTPDTPLPPTNGPRPVSGSES